MSKCWQANPDMRPTFETIEHEISHFLQLSMKQEDSYKKETGGDSDSYSRPNDQSINYVRLSNYGNENNPEMEENFPCSVDSHQDMNTNNGSTMDHQTVGHLLEHNELTGAALSKVSVNSRDSYSSACSVSPDECSDTPTNNVRNYPVDDVTSEYTHL